jgi:hypothetical protein
LHVIGGVNPGQFPGNSQRLWATGSTFASGLTQTGRRALEEELKGKNVENKGKNKE